MPKTFPFRILLVDDNAALLAATEAILSEAGYQVNTARDGFEALASLRGSVPELLITDLHMPGMSGFELLGVVRKRFPSMAVLAVSAEFTPLSLPEGVLADRFLAKDDLPPFELLEVVRQLTAAGAPRSQPARAKIAPAWLPRSARGYVVITCPDCLRSFSVPSNGIEVGKQARVTCVHCATDVSYYLDPSVLPEPASLMERMRERIDSSKETMDSSRAMVQDSMEAIERSAMRQAAKESKKKSG